MMQFAGQWLVCMAVAFSGFAGGSSDPLPLAFEPNQGHAPAEVDFIARGSGYTLTLSHGGAALAAPGGVLRLSLEGANTSPIPNGVEPLPGRVNYFKGRDQSQWRVGIPTYQKARYDAVYPGIDVVYYPMHGELEYDFIVAPGADYRDIRLRFEGHDAASVSDTGGLALTMGGAAVFQHAPVSYQDILGHRVAVESRYIAYEDGTFGFEVGAFDPAFDLIIDPLMTYGAVLSGSLADQGTAVVTEGGTTPAVYMTGYTESADFTTANTTFGPAGGRDIFIARFDPRAQGKTTLQWVTIIGGAGTDTANGIAIYEATSDHIFVAGTTTSTDLPVTVNAVEPDFAGGASDGFLLAISDDGTTLEHLTYVGGSGDDILAGVSQLNGNVFVAGESSSTDFATTVNAFDAALSGTVNPVVARFDFGTGSGNFTLAYGSYLGSDTARASGVTAITSTLAAIVGETSDGLDLKNDFQGTFGGGATDGFVAAFDTSASIAFDTLVFSSYMGGDGQDGLLACDANAGDIYMAGYTESTNLPANAGQTRDGQRDAFYSRVTPNLGGPATLQRVYLFGGDGSDTARGLAVFSPDDVYLTGTTDSQGGIVPDAPGFEPLQTDFGGGASDAFAYQLIDTAAPLEEGISTYLGGAGADDGFGVATDAAGRVYLAGATASTGFPLSNEFADSFLGGREAFLVQLSEVVFVDAASPVVGLPCGARWDSACADMQSAITTAQDYDEIWMVGGDYTEDDLGLSLGESVYGGFAGGETRRDARDWNTNITTIDAGGAEIIFDLDSNCVLDGLWLLNSAGDRAAVEAVLKFGVRIRNCYFRGNSSTLNGGAVFFNSGSDNIVSNSIFALNSADRGGAIFFGGGSGGITNCSFYGNTAPTAGPTLYNDSSFVTPSLKNSIVRGIGDDSAQVENGAALFAATNSFIEGGYTGTAISTVDPLYVNELAANPVPADFKLQATSLAINAGIEASAAASGYVVADFGGDARLISGGCNYDAGAWEAAVTAPVITLGGDASVDVEFGSTYSDDGATAADGCGDDISLSIATVNPVNTNALGPYTVTYNVSDFRGVAAVQVVRAVQVVDTTGPVITLQGATPDTVECGSGTYTDPGATASDAVDGTITGIVGTGVVDTTTPGTYTLAYDVDDAAGNPAVTVNRTVNVVDTTAPVILLSGLAAETIQCNTTYNDAGATVTDNCDATVVVVRGGDTVNTAVPGDYTITYDAQDADANDALQLTRVVTVEDTTDPIAVARDITVQLNGSGSVNIVPADVDNGSADTCGGVILSLDITTFNCGNLGPNTVTLTATDAAGNTDTATATVTVEDPLPPTAAAGGITVALDATGNAVVTPDQLDDSSTDNCVVSTLSLDVTTFDCSDLGPNVVTLTATDPAGNTDTATGTVTVEDTTAPTASAQNITVQLDGNGSASITPAQIDNGSTDACGAPTLSLDFATFDCSDAGPNTVMLTATDGSGNFSTATAVVTVEDTVAPVAVAQDVTVQLDAAGAGFITPTQINNGSSDNCGGPTLSLDVTTVTCADLGNKIVTLTATDTSGNTATDTATVTVVDNLPPVFTLNGPAVSTLVCGGTYTELGATATDNCTGDPEANIVIGGDTVNPNVPGTYTITYDVSDDEGNAATQLTRAVTVENNTDPAITLIGDAAETIECGAAYTELGATAADGCNVNLDSDIVIGGDTVNTAVPGDYVITYDVTDADGNDATQVTRTVTVADSIAPTLIVLGATALSLECGASFTDPGATATDTCDGVLTPAIVVGGDTVDTSVPATYTITYGVTDAEGNTASGVRTVTVTDSIAPTLALNGDPVVNVACQGVYTELGATALDGCAGDISGAVTKFGAVDTTVPGSYLLTYNVTDVAGNAAVAITRTVNVVDALAPVLTLNGAADITIACGGVFTDPGVTALDGCEGDLAGAVVVGGDVVDTDAAGDYVITYSVEDGAGNAAAQVSRTVTVEDGDLPTLTLNGAAVITLNCGDTFTDPGATATDGCIGDLSAAIVTTGAVDTDLPGSYDLTYTVTDPSGNAATPVTRTVVVLDNCVVAPGCDPGCDGQPLTDADGDGLTACEETFFGTSDGKTDSDGDGMSDNWEVQYCPVLDPADELDRDENPDEDALTNLEEFLRQSDPTDPASPDPLVYVAPPASGGVDAPGRGSKADPYATIGFAISEELKQTGETLLIILAPGIYPEDVVLAPGVKIKGADDPASFIQGTVVGAEGAELIDLVLAPGVPRPLAILTIDNAAMRIAGVRFQGAGNQRLYVGVRITGDRADEVLFDACVFDRLAIGIEVDAGLPIMRFCTMGNIPGAGMIIRCAPGENQVAQLAADDPRWGYNTFEPSVTGPAVINECPVELNMERVDWGFEVPSEEVIDETIVGEVNFDGFLALGGAVFSSSLFCTVWDAEDQNPILNARVSLLPSVAAPVTRNQGGVYAFEAVGSGSYTVQVAASGFETTTAPVLLQGGALESVIVPLTSDGSTPEGEGEGALEGEGEGEGGGEGEPCGCSQQAKDGTQGAASGDPLVAGLALLALLVVSALGRRRPTRR